MGALLLAMLLSQTDGWTVTTTARPLPPPLPSLSSSAPAAPSEVRWTGYPGSALPAAPPEQPRVALLVDPGAAPAIPDALPESFAARASDAPVPAEVPAAPPREESWPLPLASSPEVEAAPQIPAAAQDSAAPSLPAAGSVPEPVRAGGVEGYQSARWGSSLDEVAALFPNAAKQAPAQLTTKGLVAGENAETRFFFVDDRLVAVTITFDEAPTRPARYLALYSTVKEGLTAKYGPLAAEKEEWDGDHFRQMDRAMALVLGGLRLAASWSAGATGIALSCEGGELKGRVQINYASLALAPLLQQEAQRRQLEGL